MFHAQALELLNRIHRSLGPISVRPVRACVAGMRCWRGVVERRSECPRF